MTSRFPIHIRFIYGLAMVAAGMFLALVSRIWADDTVQWIAIVIGAIALLGGLAAAALTSRGPLERGSDLLISLLGVWTIASAFIFDGTTRLDFALWEGVALALLGGVGLFLHEQTTERVVHELQVTHRAESRTPIDY